MDISKSVYILLMYQQLINSIKLLFVALFVKHCRINKLPQVKTFDYCFTDVSTVQTVS